MNNDGLDDVLIAHSNGGRSNPTYYLYLIESDNYKINRILGFENLPNPDVDGDIITSVALAGANYLYKFYIIKNRSLIDLKQSFNVDMGDSVKYHQTIKMLKEKYAIPE